MKRLLTTVRRRYFREIAIPGVTRRDKLRMDIGEWLYMGHFSRRLRQPKDNPSWWRPLARVGRGR